MLPQLKSSSTQPKDNHVPEPEDDGEGARIEVLHEARAVGDLGQRIVLGEELDA